MADGFIEFGAERQGLAFYTYLGITRMKESEAEGLLMPYKIDHHGPVFDANHRVH